MPLASPDAWSRTAVRALIALCAFTLLATAFAASVEPVAARDLSGQIAANRYGQLYSERAMRAQDQLLGTLKREQKAAKKALRQARRNLKNGRRALSLVRAVVRQRVGQLKTVDGLFADPSEAPSPEAYLDRLKRLRKSVRVAQRRKASITRRVRAMTRDVRVKQARLRSLKRQRRVAIYRRESAEASLAARITQMTALAAARAENQASVHIAGSASFSWPTTGRISQTYGCTGFRLNPRRGSCRHFHDGIDIVDVSGTPIRAVAVGVVAYAGWNPWDERGRAWIVVVVHPDGYVSRYGHLTPTKRVRAGELVHTGQIIGKMGNTGRSTGTHLHFELLRGGRDVNPMAYLPAGVIKVDKTSTKKGKQALKAKKKARKQAQKARAKAKRAKKALAQEQALQAAADACSSTQAAELDVDTYGYPVDTELDEAVDCVVDQPSAPDPGPLLQLAPETLVFRSVPAVEEPPGVPRPPRGTSPVPV